MIQIPDKTSATTIYFPISTDKGVTNDYMLTIKTEAYDNTFAKSITDIGNSSNYIKSSILLNEIPDGEYSYMVTQNGICYSNGLICIGEYINGEIAYTINHTFIEYDPNKI